MEQKKLTKDQALVCAKMFSDYFDRYENVEQYMRDQKLNSMNEKPMTLPGMGPEDDLFSDFSMHPNDMEFKLVEPSAPNTGKALPPKERWEQTPSSLCYKFASCHGSC